ncbi:hypothetical protein KJ693_11220, partial [bacterium]|nr:hypothetical protein [bacterium]
MDNKKIFPPGEEFSKKAYIKSLGEYQSLYQEAENDPEGFWAKQAEELSWFKKWDNV